jgi:hypothetical protein
VSHHGGGSEDAGDRQLGHPLHLSRSPNLESPGPIAKAGEITIIAIATPKSSFIMTLSRRQAIHSAEKLSNISRRQR